MQTNTVLLVFVLQLLTQFSCSQINDSTKNINYFSCTVSSTNNGILLIPTFNNSSNIKLPKQFFMKLTPQCYYFGLDEQDGFYFTGSMTLARRIFPLSISAIINKTIQTDITSSKNSSWNASLIYSFNKKYV